MDWDEKREALEAFIEGVEEPKLKGDLIELLYSASEMGVCHDLVIREETAILIWKMVESVRQKEFPDELCM